jgi:hypothetical protein
MARQESWDISIFTTLHEAEMELDKLKRPATISRSGERSTQCPEHHRQNQIEGSIVPTRPAITNPAGLYLFRRGCFC